MKYHQIKIKIGKNHSILFKKYHFRLNLELFVQLKNHSATGGVADLDVHVDPRRVFGHDFIFNLFYLFTDTKWS